jgi:hypothetical protein
MSQNYVRNRFGFSVLEIDVNDLESVIFLGSHPLGQGAVCLEKGTFVHRRFVAQWCF